jgi:hypothetical protein
MKHSLRISTRQFIIQPLPANNNVILLGGNQLWSARIFLNTEGFHIQDGVILNRNRKPGEKALYKSEFDPVTNELTRDYALVLMLPNEKERITFCSFMELLHKARRQQSSS